MKKMKGRSAQERFKKLLINGLKINTDPAERKAKYGRVSFLSKYRQIGFFFSDVSMRMLKSLSGMPA